ncbi:MAG: GNAT family N-acetyltransferase [Roseobacter sp.]
MVTFRPFTNSDRNWVQQSNLAFYQSAHKFDETFATVLAQALDHLEEKSNDRTSTYLIAQTPNGPVGSIFLSSENKTTARIRLFYIAKAHRGKGIGAQMLLLVLTDARTSGFDLVRVSTFNRHLEAAHLYEKCGFYLTSQTPTEAFGQSMYQLDYELALSLCA